MALSDGLICRYKLDGNSLATVGGVDGVDSNINYKLHQNGYGMKADFNGTNSVIRLDGLIPLLSNKTIGSISFNFIQSLSGITGNRQTFTISTNNANNTAFFISHTPFSAAIFDILVGFQINETFSYVKNNGNLGVCQNLISLINRCNITVTQDGSGLKIYVNGLQIPTVTVGTPGSRWFKYVINDQTINANTVRIGNLHINNAESGYFKGGISDFRIYDRVITTSEMKELAIGTEENVNYHKQGIII